MLVSPLQLLTQLRSDHQLPSRKAPSPWTTTQTETHDYDCFLYNTQLITIQFMQLACRTLTVVARSFLQFDDVCVYFFKRAISGLRHALRHRRRHCILWRRRHRQKVRQPVIVIITQLPPFRTRLIAPSKTTIQQEVSPFAGLEFPRWMFSINRTAISVSLSPPI